MEQGRRRKDGGSNVLENSMNKMKGYNNGGTRRSTDPEPPIKLTKKQKEELEALGYGDEPPFYNTLPRDMDAQANPEGAPQKLPLKAGTRAKSGVKAYETYASGGSMKVKGYSDGGSCRGAGKAIQGTKFRGVR